MTSVRCLIGGHEFLPVTGIFNRTSFCIKCGKEREVKNVEQTELADNEQDTTSPIVKELKSTIKLLTIAVVALAVWSVLVMVVTYWLFLGYLELVG